MKKNWTETYSSRCFL